MCFSVLQCVVVRCGVLRCVVVCCSVLRCVAVCCRMCCSVCCSVCCIVSVQAHQAMGSESPVCCSVLQCVAVCCGVLRVSVRHTFMLQFVVSVAVRVAVYGAM